MKKRILCALLALCLPLTALGGCGKKPAPETTAPVVTLPTETETEPVVIATTPPDGNPNGVTCKGTYTGEGNPDAIVAQVEDSSLTNGGLQAWYWAAAARYAQSGAEPQPDFSADLATQACDIDASVGSWQQYFLRQALNSWHAAQALVLDSQSWVQPLEEAYQPNEKDHEKYLVDIPATKYLYGEDLSYRPNTLHQQFLDDLPQYLNTLAQNKGYADAETMAREAFGTTAADLTAAAELQNRGYMFFTELTYYLEEPSLEEAGAGEKTVDIRHILLLPEDAQKDGAGRVTASETGWTACEEEAAELLASWKKEYLAGEATFANLAHDYSQDPGTVLDGGSYAGLRQGQLPAELEGWCFDGSRQAGETAILRSPYGVHILFFVRADHQGQARRDLRAAQENALLENARQAHPMTVTYSAITLAPGAGTVSAGELLYPDLGHERFPEAPLYLQRDYPTSKYGAYRLSTHGCGITTMAMLASYMGDDLLTPPMLAARYGRYCFEHGTDGALFVREPPAMGFYLKEKTFQSSRALELLKQGYLVVSSQSKGYWTRGGHFILLEKYNAEDDTIQVRDSNILNYGRIKAHQQDRHAWKDISPTSKGYWVYEKKINTLPICTRCGDPEGLTPRLVEGEYLCRKCQPALLRREAYLGGGVVG